MKVAVVGATGLVGTRMLQVLAERNFPVTELYPVASGKSVGRKVVFKGKEYEVISAEDAIAKCPDLALFSAGGSVSAELAPRFAEVGCRVVDNSSQWRMDPTKKLVIPEINGDCLEESDMIIANPNCSTIQMLIAIAPLHYRYKIKRIVVSTYQSVSGTGYKALNQMNAEREGGKWGEYPAVYPCPIDMNILPHIDVFQDNGYTKEEMKMFNETRKIMHEPEISVSAMCVRVPVLRAHSEAVWVETERPISVDEAREAFAKGEGLVVIDNPAEKEYPMPLFTSGKDPVYVGRIRKDLACECGLSFCVVGDQIKKGAALIAVQIAQYLLAHKK